MISILFPCWIFTPFPQEAPLRSEAFLRGEASRPEATAIKPWERGSLRNMQKKTLFILIGVLVAAGVAWSSLVWWQQRSLGEGGLVLFEKTKKDVIDRMVITNAAASIELIRGGEGWTIQGYPADPENIREALDLAAEVRLIDVVSKNPQHHVKFLIGDTEGIGVTFKKGDATLADFLIGAVSDETYVRRKNEPLVFRTDKNLRSLFSVTVSDWRNKTVFSVEDEHAVQNIVLTRPGGKKAQFITLRLTRSENGAWRAEDDAGRATTTDPLLMTRFFSSVKPLKADSFVEAPQDLALFQKEQKVFLRVEGAHGTIAEVSFLERPKTLVWWAQRVGSETAYAIPSYRLTDILLTRGAVFGE